MPPAPMRVPIKLLALLLLEYMIAVPTVTFPICNKHNCPTSNTPHCVTFYGNKIDSYNFAIYLAKQQEI